MAQRALCLINPKAKSGEASADKLEELLAAAGLEARMSRTTSSEAAEETLRREAGGYDLVIVGGGDGTLSQLAAAVLESGRPLQIDVDGDLGLSTPARFTIEPAALPVLVPRETLPTGRQQAEAQAR